MERLFVIAVETLLEVEGVELRVLLLHCCNDISAEENLVERVKL